MIQSFLNDEDHKEVVRYLYCDIVLRRSRYYYPGEINKKKTFFASDNDFLLGFLFFMLLYATLLLLRSLLHTAVLVGVPSILEACFFEICFALRVRKQANRPGVLFFAKKDKKPTRGNESRRCFYSTIKYYFLHYESAFKRPCCQHIWKTCIENPKTHAVTMVEKLLQKSHFTKWFEF